MLTTIIYNPQSGRLRRDRTSLERAVTILRQMGTEVVLQPTTGPNMAGLLARQAAEAGAERILAAGGDGTLNEVVNGMVGVTVPIGVLPAGTANVFAAENRLGRNPVEGARRLAGCEPVPLAVGRLTTAAGTRHFLCMLGAGLDAAIVRQVSPALKRRLGKLSYWAGGFSQVGRRLTEFDVEIDGRRTRSSFALLSRVKNYGGDLEIARHADLRAAQFAAVLFAGPSTWRYLYYFSGVLFNALGSMRGVTVTHAASAVLDGRMPLQVDGEDAGDGPARVEIVPEAIRMLLPR